MRDAAPVEEASDPLRFMKVQAAEGQFPFRHGGTPSYHPNFNGISPEINHPAMAAMGDPHHYGNLQILLVESYVIGLYV